jgi:glycerol-3-phosphate dehydrogenase
VNTNADDVKYVLRVANEYFPGAQLTAKDIIATYAGIRPLVDDGSQTEGKTSREHKILTTENGVTFVMGGKYTTYRLISEEATEQALRDFSREDQAIFASNKTDLPLNPYCSADNYQRALVLCDHWSKTFHLSPEDTAKLVFRHGMEAEEMLKHGYGQSLSRLEMELLHAIRHTMCLTLVDFYTRRCPLFLSEPSWTRMA